MYRVFEALEDLVRLVEEAHSVPMTSNCMVPRNQALTLLDDVRNNFPEDLDNAQDVLDDRDRILSDAETHATALVGDATAEADSLVSTAQADAQQMVEEARARAERMLADAQDRSREMLNDAQDEADRLHADARRDYDAATARAAAEADRLIATGNESYERSVHEGLTEQKRLVSEAEVVRAANDEANRIVDSAHAASDRLRGECDTYVDTKLAEFEQVLGSTLRAVGRGRSELRATQRSTGPARGQQRSYDAYEDEGYAE